MDAQAVIESLDFTLLNHEATEEELEGFVSRANSSEVGAVCVFSEHAEFVKERLNPEIKLAVVAAGFPIGSSCLLYTSPSPRDKRQSRMPSSA